MRNLFKKLESIKIPLIWTISGMVTGYVILSPFAMFMAHAVHSEYPINEMSVWEVYSPKLYLWSLHFTFFSGSLSLIIGILHHRLKRNVEEIKKAYNELELRVKERTADLEANNEILQLEVNMRRATEQELAESEERYRKLFDESNDAVFIYDLKGKILDVNPKACEMLGYTYDELLSIPVTELHSEETLSDSMRAFEDTLKKGSARFESQFKKADGTLIDVDISSKIVDHDKMVVQGIVRDITERKKMEKALRDSGERLKTILDSLRVGVLIIDVETRKIIDVNPNAVNIIKAPFEDIIGKVCHNFLCPAEEGNCPICDLGQEVDNSERILIDANGEEIPILKSVVSVMLNGRSCFVESFMDITNLKRLEQSQRELNEVLGILNKILRHDILNDLNVVSNYIEVYRDVHDGKLLDKALKSIEKSVNLIKQMKELETLVSNGDNLTPMKVRELVEEVISNYPIDFNIIGDCTVIADHALRSVIDNIIRNAITHGKADRIDVMMEDNGETAEIRISDNGKGIPDRIKNKIFREEFKYGETGNTGLGLYIVKKTVERYGGEVYVEDNEPNGSIFVLKLKSPEIVIGVI